MKMNPFTAAFFSFLPAVVDAQEVLVMAPEFMFGDPGFNESMGMMSNDLGVSVESIPWDWAGVAAMVAAGHIDGYDGILFLGIPARERLAAEETLESFLDRRSPGDIGFSYHAEIPGFPLGAGFGSTGTQEDWANGLVLSLPSGMQRDIGVVYADVWQTGSSDSEDISQRLSGWLETSDGGMLLRHSMTILPFAPLGDSGETPELLHDRDVRIEFRPENLTDDDDGCGCEDSLLQSCDPDGASISDLGVTFSDDGSKLSLPVAPGSSADDDDGCGCENSRFYSWERFQNSSNLQVLLEKADKTGYSFELDEHLSDLEDQHSSGRMVLVLACDPD